MASEYCTKCGALVAANAKYCPSCGTRQDRGARRVRRGERGFPWWIFFILFAIPWLWWLIPIIVIVGILRYQNLPEGWQDGFIEWIGNVLRDGTSTVLYLIATVLAVLSVLSVLVLHSTPALIVTVVVLLAVLLLAQSVRGAPAQGRDARLRREIEERLDQCHVLIAEIEGDVALDMLGASDPLRVRYVHALEMRAEAADLFRVADTRQELLAAEARLDRALQELRTIRYGLSGGKTEP